MEADYRTTEIAAIVKDRASTSHLSGLVAGLNGLNSIIPRVFTGFNMKMRNSLKSEI